MSASINYVIASYMGERQGALDDHPSIYLPEHIESLDRLAHDLAQITIVVSGDSLPAVMQKLPKKIRSTPVTVLHRPNAGLSYGAFSDTFDWYGGAFSHYLFTEDDYIFTQDLFDRFLLRALDAQNIHNRCGMICGAAYKMHHEVRKLSPHKHAAVSIGLSSSEALLAATEERPLPYSRSTALISDGFIGQTEQSYALIEAGWPVEDWLAQFSCAYWESALRSIRWFSRSKEPGCRSCGLVHQGACDDPPSLPAPYGDFDLPSLVIPIQALHMDAIQVTDGRSWRTGTVDRSGHVHLQGEAS